MFPDNPQKLSFSPRTHIINKLKITTGKQIGNKQTSNFLLLGLPWVNWNQM